MKLDVNSYFVLSEVDRAVVDQWLTDHVPDWRDRQIVEVRIESGDLKLIPILTDERGAGVPDPENPNDVAQGAPIVVPLKRAWPL